MSPHKSCTSDLRTERPSGGGGAPHPSTASSGTHRIPSAAAVIPELPRQAIACNAQKNSIQFRYQVSCNTRVRRAVTFRRKTSSKQATRCNAGRYDRSKLLFEQYSTHWVAGVVRPREKIVRGCKEALVARPGVAGIEQRKGAVRQLDQVVLVYWPLLRNTCGPRYTPADLWCAANHRAKPIQYVSAANELNANDTQLVAGTLWSTVFRGLLACGSAPEVCAASPPHPSTTPCLRQGQPIGQSEVARKIPPQESFLAWPMYVSATVPLSSSRAPLGKAERSSRVPGVPSSRNCG